MSSGYLISDQGEQRFTAFPKPLAPAGSISSKGHIVSGDEPTSSTRAKGQAPHEGERVFVMRVQVMHPNKIGEDRKWGVAMDVDVLGVDVLGESGFARQEI